MVLLSLFKCVDRLRQEEAAIEEWEFKQTSKALKDIKKLEVRKSQKQLQYSVNAHNIKY